MSANNSDCVCGDPELQKLLDAYLKINKSGRARGLNDFKEDGCVRFKNPAKEKMMCAIEGDDGSLEEAIEVIQNYGKTKEKDDEDGGEEIQKQLPL